MPTCARVLYADFTKHACFMAVHDCGCVCKCASMCTCCPGKFPDSGAIFHVLAASWSSWLPMLSGISISMDFLQTELICSSKHSCVSKFHSGSGCVCSASPKLISVQGWWPGVFFAAYACSPNLMSGKRWQELEFVMPPAQIQPVALACRRGPWLLGLQCPGTCQ